MVGAGGRHSGMGAGVIDATGAGSCDGGPYRCSVGSVTLSRHKPCKSATERGREAGDGVDLEPRPLARLDHAGVPLSKLSEAVEVPGTDASELPCKREPLWKRIHEYHCYHEYGGSQAS